MTCTACGEKPKDTTKAFPKAVVEINNPETLVLLRKVVIPTSMGDEESVPPAIGKYRNVLLQYEANGHIYLYSSDGIPTAIEANVPQEVWDAINELELDVGTLDRNLTAESGARERGDAALQQEIDDLKNSPDVVDIVATYADLMAYDTSGLGDNDVIRVLRDETHDGQSSYYRWSTTTQTWTFIGTVGDYYTKQQVDALLDEKQDELTPGDNISIEDESGALVISATDTTYSAGPGLNLASTTFSVDTSTIATKADLDNKQDVLTAGDNITIEDESGALVISASGGDSIIELTSADYNYPTANPDGIAAWLLSDGIYHASANILYPHNSMGKLAAAVTIIKTTDGNNAKIYYIDDTTWRWQTTNATTGANVARGVFTPTVVQTTGTSTTDVMSQNATSSMVYRNGDGTKIQIGYASSASGSNEPIAIGPHATASGFSDSIAIGQYATATSNGAIAIGGGNSAIDTDAEARAAGAIALGPGAKATQRGQMDIGSANDTSYGYNNSNYRLLTGLYDGQSAHDAVTKGQMDTELSYKQDELTPGTGISITDESGALVISATGADIATINAQDWSALWQ